MVPEVSGRLNQQRVVTGLGVLGITPFLLALFWPDPEISLRAFSLYSLAIFCFLCGNWWSTVLLVPGLIAAQRIMVLLLSNLLLLIALVLVYLEMSLGLPGLALLYGGLMAGEHWLPPFARQPVYYRRMRQGVTVVVMLLHLACWWRLA